MKNIHLIPTDKPSNITIQKRTDKLLYDAEPFTHDEYDVISNQNIYIASNENPKANVYCLINGVLCKTELLNDKIVSRQLSGGATMDICKSEYSEIILTDNKDLIKDGVQAINDEFLEWFVNNPSCEEVEVDRIELNTDYRSDWKQKFRYKIIIPKEKPKQETLEEAIKREYEARKFNSDFPFDPQSFKAGAKWQSTRMYTEKDLRDAYNNGMFAVTSGRNFNDWFKQLKKK